MVSGYFMFAIPPPPSSTGRNSRRGENSEECGQPSSEQLGDSLKRCWPWFEVNPLFESLMKRCIIPGTSINETSSGRSASLLFRCRPWQHDAFDRSVVFSLTRRIRRTIMGKGNNSQRKETKKQPKDKAAKAKPAAK